MAKSIRIRIGTEELSLLAEKAIFWHDKDYLLVSDVHAGKANLFRDHGIPISSDLLLRDLLALEDLLDRFTAKKLFILGDLFHSSHNQENDLVLDWLNNLPIPYLLVEGNHDQHSIPAYEINSKTNYEEGEILLVHEDTEDQVKFTISGHLHPAFTVRGKGRQSLRFPCFWRRKNSLVMPAFGRLTGTHRIKPSAEDQIFLVGDKQLIPVTAFAKQP